MGNTEMALSVLEKLGAAIRERDEARAEAKRLREWVAFFQRESPTERLVLCAESALDGAEVPK